MNNISDALKIYELSKIWKEAAYNFAFWDRVDLDWDEEYKKALSRVLETKNLYEYYRELMRFVMLLGDGHTGVNFPGEIYQSIDCFSMLPVVLHRFGKDVVVINVTEDKKDIIPLYSTLKKIDGEDADAYIREKCYPFIWHANEAACGAAAMQELMMGPCGSKALYTFENDGKQFDVMLEKSDPRTMVWSKTDFSAKSDVTKKVISNSPVHEVCFRNNIAVIKITSFDDRAAIDRIYECYAELDKADGYIVDVRANIGGNSDNADALAALFINGDFKSCFAQTQIYEPTFKAWSVFREDLNRLSPAELKEKYANDPGSIKTGLMGRNMFFVESGGDVVKNTAPGRLSGPVVVLMNANTVSAAEDFVDVMKMYTDAVFVGNNTAGTSGQPLYQTLESGGSFRICTRRCIAQNGEDIYNKGFSPDETILPTVESLAAGRDVVLEKGLEVCLARISN